MTYNNTKRFIGILMGITLMCASFIEAAPGNANKKPPSKNPQNKVTPTTNTKISHKTSKKIDDGNKNSTANLQLQLEEIKKYVDDVKNELTHSIQNSEATLKAEINAKNNGDSSSNKEETVEGNGYTLLETIADIALILLTVVTILIFLSVCPDAPMITAAIAKSK